MKRRKPPRQNKLKPVPNRTYGATPEALVPTLLAAAEWPLRERGTLAQRTRTQKNPAGERAAAAHDLVFGLQPYLSPGEEVQLFLDESRPAPVPPDRVGATEPLVRRSSRVRLRLAGRLQGGQALKLVVTHERKSHRAPGHYELDHEGHRTGKWLPGRVSEAYKTRIDLRIRFRNAAAKSFESEELIWLMNVPAWTKETQVQVEEDTSVVTGLCNGIAPPGDLADWVVSAAVALMTQCRAPTTSPSPEICGLFHNLVLAVLVDQHLDPSEVEFLSTRARWLGLSTEEAQRLAAQVTSGEVSEFYRPDDPVAGRLTFRQTVEALYADGELTERERKLIRFLGRGLDVNQGELAQALGEVPPGPHWEFAKR